MTNNKHEMQMAEEIAKKVLKNNGQRASKASGNDQAKDETKNETTDKAKANIEDIQHLTSDTKTAQEVEQLKSIKKQNQTKQANSDTNLEKEETTTLSLDNLLVQNQELKAEYAKLKDTHLRSLSDIENTRKRLQKDKIEAVKYSPSEIIKDFFTVYDNLTLALQSINSTKQNLDTIKSLITGVEMTRNEMISVFSRHNIEIISPNRGDTFDWDVHLAGGTIIDDDLPDGSVSKTLSVGVLYHDRLLRPATVLVCKNDDNNDSNEKDPKLDKKQKIHIDKTV